MSGHRIILVRKAFVYVCLEGAAPLQLCPGNAVWFGGGIEEPQSHISVLTRHERLFARSVGKPGMQWEQQARRPPSQQARPDVG